MESEAETDVFHARVISDWGEDADEDFFENNSEEFLCKMFVNTWLQSQLQDSSFSHTMDSFRYYSSRR